MKRLLPAVLCLSLCACTQGSEPPTSASPSSSVSSSPEPSADIVESPDSWTVSVQRSEEFDFEDGTMQTFDLDGMLAAASVSDNPDAHLLLNINANGLESKMEGWYTGGRLYNTYNSVNYYEDLTLSNLEKMLLVPIGEKTYSDDEIASEENSGEGKDHTRSITLTTEAALSLYLSEYDQNNLSQYENLEMNSGVIEETYDSEGKLVRRTSEFQCTFSVQGSPVALKTDTSLEYSMRNETAVEIPSEITENPDTYVSYLDIDTEAISDADLEADAPASTATETFRKRLISRLGYEVEDNGMYYTVFNDNESYEIDFEHDQFIYRNYSTSYVYNWKGDTGGFGSSCSIDFSSGVYTDGCDEDVVEMMKTVRNFFIMELYYCGVSLNDLQKEAD